MKFLLVIVVVGVLLWLLLGRRRGVGDSQADDKNASPLPMIACAHCGVHLPRADALFDAAGRPFCGAAHRIAGPR